MKSFPYVIDERGFGESLRAVESNHGLYNESLLQELLRMHPDILPVGEIEPVFFPLLPIGREVVTETGLIDNLFISPRGYLTLVETKLWRNPEAKREVVAQAIDYGSSLAQWTYTKLNMVVRGYTKKYTDSEADLVDYIEQQFGPAEGGPNFFEETVARNLRLGRFLILIVGDKIRQSVVDMVSYVNRYPHLAADIALVELNCYQWAKEGTWPLLVVPSIVAQTKIVERSIIQVTVKQDGKSDVKVSQEGGPAARGPGERVTLTEEAFWELLKNNAPKEYGPAHDLVETYRARDGMTMEPTEGSIVARLVANESGNTLSVFFVTRLGDLGVWPLSIRAQLKRTGLDEDLVEPYHATMRELLRMPLHRKEFNRRLSEVDLSAFRAAVDSFIESVQQAEPRE